MTSPFRDPGIPDGERSSYAVKLGDKAFRSNVVSVVTSVEDRYVSTIDGRIGDRFSMSIEQTFLRASGLLRADRYKAESRFDENVVSREEGFFLETRHLQFGGRVQPFPTGLMPLVGGLTLLRGLDFTKGAKATIDLWLAFSVCWPLETKIEKRASIEVPAGRFDAWQVRVRPSFHVINGLLDKVVAGLLPPFILHFETTAPHRMLSFSFPTGPMPWDPRAMIELTG
ncbi:MAG TPA: hypothetical protein VM925_12625 [Labilithrix sp.]|nr:hypothetical protein [Labilithrix sp.]